MRCSFNESTHRRVVLQEELGVMQCQILQLYSNRQRPLQEGKSSSSKHRDRYNKENKNKLFVSVNNTNTDTSDLFKGGSGAHSGLCHREQSVAVLETLLPLCCLSSDPADSSCEQRQCECSSAPPACLSRGKLLLHCFLQGLKAGLNEGTGERTPSVSKMITTVQTVL